MMIIGIEDRSKEYVGGTSLDMDGPYLLIKLYYRRASSKTPRNNSPCSELIQGILELNIQETDIANYLTNKADA